jgi:hypothetical protein
MNATIFKSGCDPGHGKRKDHHSHLIYIVFLLIMALVLEFDHRVSWSQNASATLSGRVMDAANGETLPGANVMLLPIQRGAATDRNGRFFISNLSPGKYQLHVSFMGYDTYRDSLMLDPKHSPHLHIALKPHPLTLPEVTVSASRDRLTREVNLSQDFISSQELRMTSSVAEPDLFRTLALFPGVVQANDFNSRFYVRGGQSNENHVLVEGMTIHNPYHALGFFSSFDVDAIKAVEVYRSNFPVRYSERLSSVTNVILRDGNAQRFSGLGMVSLATSKFLLEGPLLKYQPESGRKSTFMVNGRRTYVDAILEYPLYFYDFSMKSVYDSGHKTRLTLHGFYGFDQLKGANDPFPFPSTDYADIRWNNYAFGIHWQQFFSIGSVWTNHVSYSAFHSHAEDTQYGFTDFRQENHIRELSITSEWQGRLQDKWQLTLGGGWSRFNIDQHVDRFLNNFLRRTFQGHWHGNNQYKAYAEIAGGWGERWIYEAGLAALYFSAHNTPAIAPRLGAKYRVNDTWRVKAGLGRHYQFLTTLEDDDDPVLLFDAWLPTPGDRPIARADHYGVGAEVSPASSVEADVELYYHRYDHLTRYNRTQRPGEPFYLDGWGETYGLELRAHYNFKKYYGFANFTLGWATSHFFLRNQPMRSANDFRWQTFPSNGDIRHILNAVIGIRPGDKWDFSVSFIYQSGRPYTAVLGTTSYPVELPSHWDPFPLFLGHRSSLGLYGERNFLYSTKNSRRYPFYQRVDFRASRSFTWLGMDWTFFFQIYNVFYRKNAAFHFPDFSFFHLDNKRPSGLPVVPTFGIRFRF